jgi:hypothetical protein
MPSHADMRLRLRVMGHVPRGPVNEMLPFFCALLKGFKREIGEKPLALRGELLCPICKKMNLKLSTYNGYSKRQRKINAEMSLFIGRL